MAKIAFLTHLQPFYSPFLLLFSLPEQRQIPTSNSGKVTGNSTNPTWCGLIATPLCLALFRFVFDIVSTRIEWQRRSGYKTNCLHVAASSIDIAKHKTGDDGGFCCWWYSTLALFLSCRGPLLQLYRH
jgi:hypothetical protein